MTTTTRRRNWTYLFAITITRAFMVGAAVISFTHIVTTAHLLGLNGWQAWTTPFAIDGFAALGMLGRGRQFAASTRRVGLRFAVAAGLLSLAANVYAGHTLGERLYGAIVVAAFVAAEQYADRMAPAESDTAHIAAAAQAQADAEAATQQAEASAKRSQAAHRAAETRRANAAAKAEAEAARKERRRLARQARELEAMAEGYIPADAPVSPAG